MERKAKGKGYKRPGPPLMGMGMMIPKIHERAHKKMGMNKEEKVLNKKEDPIVETTKPGKSPENKKEN